MLRSCLLILVVALTGLAADVGTAQAGVSISIRHKFFSVSGSSIQDVVRSLKRNGPLHRDIGRRAIGLADFRHRYRLTTTSEGGRCKVSKVHVSLRIILTLPRLSSRARLSARHGARWRTIEAMIRRHENRHAALYKQFARALERRLKRLRPAASCSALRSKARQIEKSEFERDRRRNRAYDRASYPAFNKRLKSLSR